MHLSVFTVTPLVTVDFLIHLMHNKCRLSAKLRSAFSLLSWRLFGQHRGFPSPDSDVQYVIHLSQTTPPLTVRKVMLAAKLKFSPTLVIDAEQLASQRFRWVK